MPLNETLMTNVIWEQQICTPIEIEKEKKKVEWIFVVQQYGFNVYYQRNEYNSPSIIE